MTPSDTDKQWSDELAPNGTEIVAMREDNAVAPSQSIDEAAHLRMVLDDILAKKQLMEQVIAEQRMLITKLKQELASEKNYDHQLERDLLHLQYLDSLQNSRPSNEYMSAKQGFHSAREAVCRERPTARYHALHHEVSNPYFVDEAYDDCIYDPTFGSSPVSFGYRKEAMKPPPPRPASEHRGSQLLAEQLCLNNFLVRREQGKERPAKSKFYFEWVPVRATLNIGKKLADQF